MPSVTSLEKNYYRTIVCNGANKVVVWLHAEAVLHTHERTPDSLLV